jgi:hypothetical protein
MYPGLAGSIGGYVGVRDGRDYLIHIVLGGMSGPIDVKGVIYNGLMPEFSQLSDAEIAATLNDVLTRFDAAQLPKDFTPFAANEVARARAAHPAPAEMARARQSILDRLAHPARANEAAR